MPTYDYHCRGCEHRFEHFQSMTSRLLRKCPECGEKKLRRLIGSGAGVIFKGSGFYETDYKRGRGGKSSSSEGEGHSGDNKSGDKKSGDKKSSEETSDERKSGDAKSDSGTPKTDSSKSDGKRDTGKSAKDSSKKGSKKSPKSK